MIYHLYFVGNVFYIYFFAGMNEGAKESVSQSVREENTSQATKQTANRS